jgi:hypothetical protein
MANLKDAFGKETDVLPKKQKARAFYSYLVLETVNNGANPNVDVLRGVFNSRGEVAKFLQGEIHRLDAFKVYKSVGLVGLKEKRTIEFEL